jgi:Uma2 family endonuclease
MKPVTDLSQLDLSKTYTYADYLTWDLPERVELILGKIFRMSPAPTSRHQYAVMVLSAALFNFLKGKPCRVFPAPFDVILPVGHPTRDTVVQPDLTVVCDLDKVTEKGCEGVPDLVVEVISKSSVTHDLHEKYSIYEMAGVKEYWVVYPIERSLLIFTLVDGRYVSSKPLTRGDVAHSSVLEAFSLELDELFADVVREDFVEYEPVLRI